MKKQPTVIFIVFYFACYFSVKTIFFANFCFGFINICEERKIICCKSTIKLKLKKYSTLFDLSIHWTISKRMCLPLLSVTSIVI